MKKNCIYVAYPDWEGRYTDFKCQCGHVQYRTPPSIGHFCPLCGRLIVDILEAPGYGNAAQAAETKKILAMGNGIDY